MLASEIVIQGLEPYAPTMSALPHSEADFLLPPLGCSSTDILPNATEIGVLSHSSLGVVSISRHQGFCFDTLLGPRQSSPRRTFPLIKLRAMI